MPIDYEPVAIPVAKGVDVTTRARLVDPQALLEAENARFTALGSEKRRGHVGRVVRGSKPLPVDVAPPNFQEPSRDNIPTEWLWGWGYMVLSSRTSGDGMLETSEHPDAGVLFGAATRDTEALFWDGFRLFSLQGNQAPGTPMTEINAVMPHLVASSGAKSAGAQVHPDAADNGVIRVNAWLNPDDSDAWYSVQDSRTLAYIVAPTALGFVEPVNVRVINVGQWIHVLVAESDVDTLYTTAIFEETPLVPTRVSLGPCNNYFDAIKIDETAWVVLVNRGDKTVRLSFLNPDTTGHTRGSYDFDYSSYATVALGNVAVAIHPTSDEIGIVTRFDDGAKKVRRQFYDDFGVQTSSATIQTVTALNMRVAIAPHYIIDGDVNKALWDIFFDDALLNGSYTYVHRCNSSNSWGTRQHAWLQIASQAFRVGDRTFIWCSRESELQATYLLMDETLSPVGHMDFITAIAPDDDTGFPHQCTMNWRNTGNVKDTLQFHTALGYRVRVPVTTPETGENEARIFTEASIRFVDLDFLPPLYSAQAGRCTYFPGSQLWIYDGVELVEQGFHIAPEVIGEGFA